MCSSSTVLLPDAAATYQSAAMRRVVVREFLDNDEGSPYEIQASLADLRRVNRWFGGIATTARLVLRVAEVTARGQFSLLEVAAASGDVPAMVSARLATRGVRLDCTLLDRVVSHIRGAASAVAADALALPFRDRSFDLVSCALFAHHLEARELIRFAQEALRVARIAVLINDLLRHPIHLGLVYAGLPLFSSRLTRHDGPASVRRAYTVEEMRAILSQTAARRVEISRHYLFRMGVVVWR